MPQMTSNNPSSVFQPRPHGHMSLLKKTRRNGPGVGHPRDLILLVEKKVHFPGRITQDVISSRFLQERHMAVGTRLSVFYSFVLFCIARCTLLFEDFISKAVELSPCCQTN